MAGFDLFKYILWLRHLGKIMYVIVLAVVGVSWWAVVSSSRRDIARGGFSGLLTLAAVLVFNFTIAMLVYSYFACSVISPGYVPQHWSPFPDPEMAEAEQRRMAYGIARTQNRGDIRRPRWCKKCGEWKPERAHHCSVTGRCVLKMDHYCLWVLQTVGLLNYKAFLLFLAYTMLAATLATALLTRSFIDFFRDSDIEDITSAIIFFVAFVLDAAFSLSVCGFLVMHARMVAQNRTTIEMYEKMYVTPWPYDKGWRRNFEEVFGADRRRWWLPTHSQRQAQVMLDAALAPQAAEEHSLQPMAPL